MVEITNPPGPLTVGMGDEVWFDANAYNATKTSIISHHKWTWDFGDGATARKNPTTHTYLEPGVYTVTATASTHDGTGTAQQTVTVLGTMAMAALPDVRITQPLEDQTVYMPVEIDVVAPRPTGFSGPQQVRAMCAELGQGGHVQAPIQLTHLAPGGQAPLLPIGNDTYRGFWLPSSDLWGHNGAWRLYAEADYMQMVPRPNKPPLWVPVTITSPGVVVDVDNLVVDTASTAQPQGLPPDAHIIALDRSATGTPFEQPEIVVTTNLPVEMLHLNVRVFDIITGQEVAIEPPCIQKTVQANGGVWKWVGPQGAPIGDESFGLFTYDVTVEIHPWHQANTRSAYLTTSGLTGSLGVYDPSVGTLPLTLGYELTDTALEPPTEAFIYTCRASPDAAGDRFVASHISDLPLALGATEEVVDLPPLDGSQTFIILLAQDGHGSHTSDGERRHLNRMALARGARLDAHVSDVWPHSDGRVFISDHLGEGFAQSPPLYADNTRCQTANREALIQAFITVSVTDADGISAEEPTSGVRVYFTSIDPDSQTLWDSNGDGNDPDNDDSVIQAGIMQPMAAASQLVTLTKWASQETHAIAASTLQFTQQYSGDNYRVGASVLRDATGGDWEWSGTLEACKMIYYERDSMPLTGSTLAAPALVGQASLTFSAAALPPGFQVDDTIPVYDETDHAYNVDAPPAATNPPTLGAREYLVTSVTNGGFTVNIDPPIRPGEQTNAHPTGAAAVVERDFGGGIRSRMDMFVSVVDPGLAMQALAPAFVRLAALPGVPRGILPRYDMVGWLPGGTERVFFDHDEDNVVHLMDAAWHRADPGGRGEGVTGDTDVANGGDQIMVFSGHTFPPPLDFGEVLAHEFGHVFGMPDWVPPGAGGGGHADHRNHALGASDDGCAMVYDPTNGGDPPANPNDWGNGVAFYGGKVTDGPGEPLDLARDIAWHADPL